MKLRCSILFSSLVSFKSLRSPCTAACLSGPGGKSLIFSQSGPAPQLRRVDNLCTTGRRSPGDSTCTTNYLASLGGPPRLTLISFCMTPSSPLNKGTSGCGETAPLLEAL